VDGVELLELNPDLAEYFEAPDGGVLVTEVSEDSPLGLRAGDVLVAIDGREVRDPDHVRRILASYETDEEVRLRVIRQGREIEVLGRRRDG
jgi:S1-C subfamily serine protease